LFSNTTYCIHFKTIKFLLTALEKILTILTSRWFSKVYCNKYLTIWFFFLLWGSIIFHLSFKSNEKYTVFWDRWCCKEEQENFVCFFSNQNTMKQIDFCAFNWQIFLFIVLVPNMKNVLYNDTRFFGVTWLFQMFSIILTSHMQKWVSDIFDIVTIFRWPNLKTLNIKLFKN
jgi:hypothetical protein